jgi:predicted nucleotidyltransferase
MTKTRDMVIPEASREDIARAVRILKEEGCSEIFLFGSGAEGQLRDESDLDLAIRGCSSGRFFHLLGRLLWELDHPVDLVNLDTPDPFAQYLQKEGVLLQIG